VVELEDTDPFCRFSMTLQSNLWIGSSLLTTSVWWRGVGTKPLRWVRKLLYIC